MTKLIVAFRNFANAPKNEEEIGYGNNLNLCVKVTLKRWLNAWFLFSATIESLIYLRSKHPNIRRPDFIASDSQFSNVAVFGWIPHKVIVYPVLCKGKHKVN
jgi:hypothetical protein